MNIAVVGGGLSGTRAALTLARAGHAVTLFEKNRHLGGRVFSFHTPDFGEVDIGQHIWLRCCTALEELLHDLQVPDDWVYRQDRISMPYRWPDGRRITLEPGPLPGNLALLPSLLSAPGVRLSDKVRYLLGLARAALYSDQALEKLDQISFADWLRRQRQPDAVVEWFWGPLIVGICNGRLAEVSARHGLFTVRESLLKSPRVSAICLLRRPLSAVFDRHARQVLHNSRVEVRTGEAIHEVRPGTPALVHTRTGPLRPFDKIILALPLKRTRALLPDAGLPPPPQEGAIAGLLLRFAGPVMDDLFFTAVGSPVQIVFNKTAIWGKQAEDGSQVIELVISAAEREVRLGVDRVAAELLPALAHLLPAVAHIPLRTKRLLVHATATFRVPPGGEAKRPALTYPNLPNLFLAGDYAPTGWPSTMESAVRAGQAAAAHILSTAGLE